MLEEKTHLPVLGVVPYLRVDIEDEDSLSSRLESSTAVKPLDAAILRLPHISNFTDFMPLEQHPLLSVRYVQSPRQLGAPDVVILPGTKNTIDDLLWLRQCGLEAAVQKLATSGTPVLGVCGGYQMLGETLADPEGTESGRSQTVRGLGCCPSRLCLRTQSTAHRIPPPSPRRSWRGSADRLPDPYRAHCHAGRALLPSCGRQHRGLRKGQRGGHLSARVIRHRGTNRKAGAAAVQPQGHLPASAPLLSMQEYRQQQFDLLADGVRRALDMNALYAAMGLERRSTV